MSQDELNKLELSINISVRQPHYGGGTLQLSHSLTVEPRDFLEMCKILGEFDELAKRFKKNER